MNPALDWLRTFGVTLLVECPLILWFFRREQPQRGRLLLCAVFATLATHPVVWFVFPHLPLRYVPMVELSELWAFLAEAVFYWLVLRARVERAVLGSALANAASWGVVAGLRALTGWV